MQELFDRLEAYCSQDYVPLHMPGHKRNLASEECLATSVKEDFFTDWYRRDITEIEGFDNLHAPKDLLLECMERASAFYHSEATYYLINGSTSGVLTAVSAAVPMGETLIMMRSSHKSAYHAAMLRNLKTVFLRSEVEEEIGLDYSVTLAVIQEAVEAHPEARAVLVTSPTYEGISIELEAIAQYLHERNVILIVDAAHGAHFGMADFLPPNAVASGADLVIHSVHKTLPAPTQTALLHVNGNLVSKRRVEEFLSVYQSSSPSYLLMAGIDHCICMMRDLPKERWENYYERRKQLSERLRQLKHIGIFDAFSLSRMKVPELGKMLIIPDQNKMSGTTLYHKLIDEFHIQAEMALPRYVLCILGVMDRPEYYERLADALEKIDASMEGTKETTVDESQTVVSDCTVKDFPKAILTMNEAMTCKTTMVELTAADGRIAGEMVCAFPPGQPILVPGEQITKDVIDRLEKMRITGCELIGVHGTKINICIID